MSVLQQDRYQVRMRIVQVSAHTQKSQDLKSKGDLALFTSSQMWIGAVLSLGRPKLSKHPQPR